MPLYRYKCNTCNKEIEVYQNVNDLPLINCPEENCNGILFKQIGRSSFHLKGSGWFKDGY